VVVDELCIASAVVSVIGVCGRGGDVVVLVSEGGVRAAEDGTGTDSATDVEGSGRPVLDASGRVVLGVGFGIVVSIGAITFGNVVGISKVDGGVNVVSGRRVVGVVVTDGSVLSGSTVVVDSCTLGGAVGCPIVVETSTGAIDVVADGTGRGSVVVVVLELVVVLGG
jgi:hypothetical protein